MRSDNRQPKNFAETPKETADLSRRNVLRGVTLTAGSAALLAALTTQRAEAKMKQEAAGYQATPKDGQRCSGCTVFVAPASCRLVDGTISPDGYCRFFVKKS